MGLAVINNSSSKGGKVTKLKYQVLAPGGQIVIPAGGFITWMVLFNMSGVDNIVTMGTALHGIDFFNDTVLVNTPYEVAKGWQVQAATTIYIECTQNLTVHLYKF